MIGTDLVDGCGETEDVVEALTSVIGVSLRLSTYPTDSLVQIIMACHEWKTGKFIPLNAVGNHGIGSAVNTQRHCIRPFLRNLQQDFPDKWIDFRRRVRAHALLSHQHRHSLKYSSTDAAVSDFNFEW